MVARRLGVQGQGMTEKRHNGTFLGDRNVQFLDCDGGGYTGLCVRVYYFI